MVVMCESLWSVGWGGRGDGDGSEIAISEVVSLVGWLVGKGVGFGKLRFTREGLGVQISSVVAGGF